MRQTVQTSSEKPFTHSYWDMHYPHSLKMCYFWFRTPEQASNVASYIALVSPPGNSFLELGLNEIFLNAIEHGNLGINSEDKAANKNTAEWQELIYKKLKMQENISKKVKVVVEITPSYTSVEVTDDGNGFDWHNIKLNDSSPHKMHGRGLLLASQLCFDKIEFIGKGNIVRCLCWH